jgi:transcriptional antiterminator RfaH
MKVARKDKKEIIWVLIYTKVKQERRAKENLENQGFKAFLPLIALSNDLPKYENLEIVFPRYLFVQINQKLDNWSSIKSTKGVDQIVLFGNEFTAVPDKIIKSIKEKLNKRDVYKQKISKTNFNIGDKLVIKEGTFSGIDAIFISYKSKDRVKLLLKLLKTSILAEVDKSDVGLKKTIEEFKF